MHRVCASEFTRVWGGGVIDHFCYDTWLHVHTDFVPVKVLWGGGGGGRAGGGGD